MAAHGEVKIKITVDGKQVHVATGNLKDFQDAASGAGQKGKKAGEDLRSADKDTRKFDGGVKDLAKSLGLVAIGAAAFKVLSDNVGAAIKRFDALNAMPRVLEALGANTDDAERSMQRLADGIEGLPTALDEITGTMQQFFLVFRDADKATDSALALNNALLASGTSGGQAAGAMEQYIQALQKGKPDMMEWRNMQSNMAVALDEIAQKSGTTITQLGVDLRSGKLPMIEFNNMLIEIGSSTGKIGGLAKTMTAGIGTSFSNLGLAITKGLANIITSIDNALIKSTGQGIAAHLDNMKAAVNAAFSAIGTAVEAVVPIFLAAFKVVGVVIDILKALSPVIMGVVTYFAAMFIITKVISIYKTLYSAVYFGIGALKAYALAAKTTVLGTGLVTKAIAALNAAFAANPIGLIAAAIAVVVVAIIAFVKIFKSLNKEAAENQKAIDKLTESSEAHSEAVEESASAYADQTTQRNSSLRAMQSEVSELDKLSKKENKSAADKAMIAEKVEFLNSQMEGLNLTYDDEADALNMSSDALRERTDALGTITKYNDALEEQSRITMDMAENDELLAQNRELAAITEAKYDAAGVFQKKQYAKQLKELADQEKDLLLTRDVLIDQQDTVNSQVAEHADEATKLIKKLEEQAKLVDDLADSASDLAKETKKSTEELQKNSKQYQANSKQISKSADYSRALSRELDRLSGVRNKSEQDMARVQTITDLLNASNKDLNLSYDQQTDSLSMSSGERDRRIKLLEEEASYTAAMERLLEIEEDRYKAESRLEELAGFRKEYNEMMASGIPISEEQAEKFAELFAEEENLKNETKSLGTQYDETITSMEGSAERLNNLKRAFEKLSESQKESLESMVSSIQEYHSSSQNIFDKIDTSVEVSFESIMETLRHNAEAMATYWDNLAILMEAGIDDALIQTLIDAGPAAYAEAKVLADKVKADPSKVEEINREWTNAGTIPGKALETMMKRSGIPVNAETVKLIRGIETELRKTMKNVSWDDIAANIPDGLLEGAFKGKKAKEFLAGAGAFATESSDRFRRSAEIRSPSMVFFRHGQNLTQGLINGAKAGLRNLEIAIANMSATISRAMGGVVSVIKAPFANIASTFRSYGGSITSGITSGISSGSYTASNSASSLMSSITSRFSTARSAGVTAGSNLGSGVSSGISGRRSATSSTAASFRDLIYSRFSGMNSKGRNIGYQLAAGVASGINNNAYRARNAAQAMSNSIPTAVRRILEIRSPSKVMEDIGANIAEGIGVGIEDEEGGILKNLSDLITKMLSLFDNISFALPEIATPAVSFGTAEYAAGGPALAYSGSAGVIPTSGQASSSKRQQGASGGTADTLITGNQFIIREEADISKIARELEDLRRLRGR